MGRGFCFEYRQKRILIDQDYFKADLIFYHRILKCHIIIDLKIDRFRHEYASQLNLYMNYYKHEVMQEDDIRKYMLENITQEDFLKMREETGN